MAMRMDSGQQRSGRALRRLVAAKRAAKRAARVPKKAPVSPLAPPGGFPALPPVEGVRLATVAAGVRYLDRTDVMLALMVPGTTVAGVTTRSSTRSAPVLDVEAKLGGDSTAAAAFLVNSGNSNAFTGAAGTGSVEAICDAVAARLDLPEARVFTASTGVIGERLAHDRITAAVDGLADALSPNLWEDAARAIMTTDTFPKGAGCRIALTSGEVGIAGFAKGSGMIAPDMGTMLVYVFTDAAIPQDVLQDMVARRGDRSFNCITVDGDTSTSDTLLVAATGASGVAPEGDDLARFEEALGTVMTDLARQVVRDGEGATKLVEVRVTGAVDDGDARKVALSIANSPLVKTAIAGEDPNWGRIVMAVGKSGAEADRDRLTIRFGEILVAEKGWVAQSYTEAAGSAYMRQAELILGVEMGLGDGAATVWTCDLTHRYIEINADYRS